MTLPGADTIKGGIMGDDFFRSSAGAPFCTGADTSGSSGTNCVRMVSTGECSGVCVACDEVEAERG
jgi:hypothetical protein